MAESVVAQVKDIPGTALGSLRSTPILAIGIIFLTLFVVLLIEGFKPGLLTNPVRSALHAMGFKSA